MNKIILPPTMLASILQNNARNESPENYLYLLREKHHQKKMTISNLYRLFFGNNTSTLITKQNDDEELNAKPEYYSSYE